MIHKRSNRSSGELEGIILRKELVAYLEQVIGDLPRIEQHRFFFDYVEKWAYEQIAEFKGCTKQSVEFALLAWM